MLFPNVQIAKEMDESNLFISNFIGVFETQWLNFRRNFNFTHHRLKPTQAGKPQWLSRRYNKSIFF